MSTILSSPATGFGNRGSGIGVRDIKQSTVLHFSKLDVWQTAMELIKQVYRWTTQFPDVERFGLISQLRRAAVSVASNIAEGFGRQSRNDKKNFYVMARGSTDEVDCQLMISQQLNFLSETELHDGQALCVRIKQMLNRLISQLTS